MKKLLSILSTSLILSLLSSCGSNQAQTLIEIPSIYSSSNNIVEKSIGEQQRLQVKLHQFYFGFYSEGSDHYKIDSKNDHILMLLKIEKRLNSTDALIDGNSDSKVTWEEIKKFVTTKLFIDDFRKNIVSFSFNKLDKNTNKSLDDKEFGAFNKEIKVKEVADFKLSDELKAFDYNNDKTLTIEEYEDFFVKYLIKKITWKE